MWNVDCYIEASVHTEALQDKQDVFRDLVYVGAEQTRSK
jgi:hypothetical protein